MTFGNGISDNVSKIPPELIVRSEMVIPQISRESLYNYVFRDTDLWADQVAYECHASGLAFTHQEIKNLSKKLANVLSELGIRKGDVVAIVLPNSPYFPLAFYGLLFGGVVANLLSPLLPEDRLTHMIEETGCKAVITMPEFFTSSCKLQNRLTVSTTKTGDKVVILCNAKLPISGHGSDGMNSSFLLDNCDDDERSESMPAASLDISKDPAVMLWSSGTTGHPKPVVHTNAGMVAQLEQLLHPGISPYQPGQDVMLAVCPWFHAFACAYQLRLTPKIGAKVVTLDKFTPDAFVQAVQRHKPTILHLVPSLIDFCTKSELLTRSDFSQLRSIFYGGIPTSQELLKAFRSKFGDHIWLQENYGMTETGCTHVIPKSYPESKFGSVGQLVANTQGVIVSEDGVPLPRGCKGELWVKGPQAMKDYLKLGSQLNVQGQLTLSTSVSKEDQGWLRTGDIGYYDNQGFFYITDRLKDIIKVKGYQVSPFVLQNILNSHPQIKDSAVIGIPHNVFGQVPKAFVVIKEGEGSLSENEIQTFMNARVAKFERLLGGIQFVKEIPKGGIGKILRHQLYRLNAENSKC